MIGLFSVALTPAAMAAGDQLLKSPDGRIRVSIRMPTSGSTERPQWSLQFMGKQVLTNCSLGLQIVNEGELTKGVRLRREHKRSVNERIPVLFGKSSYADDRFNEIRFEMETLEHRPMNLVFRCYNDAVALRYELPETGKGGVITVSD